jgi:hypothetical protein
MRKQLNYNRWPIQAMLAGILILFMAPLLYASCINVNKCETISASGSYCLPPNVALHSTGGDCLVISAPNVTLSNGAASASITGAGTASAIHVLSAATHFIGSFFCMAIDNFGVGVRDDANRAFFGNDNDCPLSTGTHVSYGVFFDNVRGSQYIGGFGTLRGQIIGLLIRGGGNNYISSDAPTAGNQEFQGGTDGIHIDGGSSGNALYGITDSGSRNGIHLLGGTTQNFIYVNYSHQNSVGIKIEQNSTRNFIIHNTASNNTSTDLVDVNTNCDSNVWAENTFTSRNQACIQ